MRLYESVTLHHFHGEAWCYFRVIISIGFHCFIELELTNL